VTGRVRGFEPNRTTTKKSGPFIGYSSIRYQLMESWGGARDVELGVSLCLSDSGAGFLRVHTQHSIPTGSLD
jgi:hypothetical protein